MNAQTYIARPWNYLSGVMVCETCNGAGTVHAHRTATVNDPYPEAACPDCTGEHTPECTVCGCNIVVPGYDCIACQMVEELPASALNEGAAIGAAVLRAINARRAAA